MDKNKINKNYYIETLRGLAILFVVAGHVIGSDSNGGMKVDDSSIYRYFYCLFENMRMPIFTVISGWVYALHPIQKEKSTIFIIKKARRLLVPLIFVGSLFYLLQHIIPGTNNKNELIDIWRIYIYPFTIYWYLPSLFLVFIVTTFLEYFNLMKSFKGWGICLVISVLACLSEQTHLIPDSSPNFFAFKGALYLLPFFIAGAGFNRFKEIIYKPKYIKIYLSGFILGIGLQQINYFIPEKTSFYSDYQLSLFIGLVASVYILSLKLKSKFFIWLATYAYTIYLFHVFGTSGGRIILKSLGTHSELLIFIVSLTIAIFAPILVEKIFIRWKVTRILLLGKK